MQNSQELNWWLEIAKIVVPSLTSIVVAIGLGLWLSARTEKIKSEFQAKLYEFQTKLNTSHQNQINAIREIFDSFDGVKSKFESYIQVGHYVDIDESSRIFAYKELLKDSLEFFSLFKKKRLDFNQEINESIKVLEQNFYEYVDLYPSLSTEKRKDFIRDNIVPLTEKVENQFHKVFTVETFNTNLEKKLLKNISQQNP